MCSTRGAQIDRICRAIEELANRTGAGGSAAAAEPAQATASEPDSASKSASASGADDAPEAGDVAAGDDLAATLARLATIWAMVAEADPELARRLPGYLAAPD
jgi:hypothetical protein